MLGRIACAVRRTTLRIGLGRGRVAMWAAGRGLSSAHQASMRPWGCFPRICAPRAEAGAGHRRRTRRSRSAGRAGRCFACHVDRPAARIGTAGHETARIGRAGQRRARPSAALRPAAASGRGATGMRSARRCIAGASSLPRRWRQTGKPQYFPFRTVGAFEETSMAALHRNDAKKKPAAPERMQASDPVVGAESNDSPRLAPALFLANSAFLPGHTFGYTKPGCAIVESNHRQLRRATQLSQSFESSTHDSLSSFRRRWRGRHASGLYVRSAACASTSIRRRTSGTFGFGVCRSMKQAASILRLRSSTSTNAGIRRDSLRGLRISARTAARTLHHGDRGRHSRSQLPQGQRSRDETLCPSPSH